MPSSSRKPWWHLLAKVCRFTRTSGNISHQHAQLLSGYGGVKLTTRRRSSQVRWSIGGRRSDVGHPKAFLTGHYGTLVVAGATGFRTNTSQKQNTRSTTPLAEAYLPGHRYRDTLKQHPRVSGERNFRGTAAETRKRASNPPSRHGSGCALSATGNRLGRTPDPHRCNIIGLRPPTNRAAACTVQRGFAGGWRGSWRPESPWLRVSARLASWNPL